MDFDKYQNNDPPPTADKSLPRKAELSTLKKFGHSTEDYPKTREEDLRERKAERRAKTEKLLELFRDDALEEIGLAHHPKRLRIYLYAWDKGHSYGLCEVMSELHELASLFLDDPMEPAP